MAGVCELVQEAYGLRVLVDCSSVRRWMAGMCEFVESVAVLSGGQRLVSVSWLLLCQEANGWCVSWLLFCQGWRV